MSLLPTSAFSISPVRFGTLAAAAVALASAALATPVLAATAQLRFDDLDMTSTGGKAAFERRAKQAITEACGEAGVTGSRLPSTVFSTCARDVQHQIEQQLARVASRTQLGG